MTVQAQRAHAEYHYPDALRAPIPTEVLPGAGTIKRKLTHTLVAVMEFVIIAVLPKNADGPKVPTRRQIGLTRHMMETSQCALSPIVY